MASADVKKDIVRRLNETSELVCVTTHDDRAFRNEAEPRFAAFRQAVMHVYFSFAVQPVGFSPSRRVRFLPRCGTQGRQNRLLYPAKP